MSSHIHENVSMNEKNIDAVAHHQIKNEARFWCVLIELLAVYNLHKVYAISSLVFTFFLFISFFQTCSLHLQTLKTLFFSILWRCIAAVGIFTNFLRMIFIDFPSPYPLQATNFIYAPSWKLRDDYTNTFKWQIWCNKTREKRHCNKQR